MKYAIQTFGCKVNQYESAVIAVQLERHGFDSTEDIKAADVVVINSCSVTETGDKKAKQLITKLKKFNPLQVIVLCGCFPQAFPDEANTLPADIIIGTEHKERIGEIAADYIKTALPVKKIEQIPENAMFNEMPLADMKKTRAFVKIEDGCDRFCTYCIIPYARGRVRSRPIEDIIRETEYQVSCGHKEIVAVGINLSCYGSDIGLRLVDAVEAICSVKGVERVRLSSLEPELITKADIDRMAKLPQLCPHFHLSLQSGCEATLNRMNRHYTPDEYMEIVQNLRNAFEGCSITTDIMVGFAGETDEEFLESLAFCEKVGFSAMHVFTYSVRGGTKAAEMTDFISADIAQKRYKRMSALAKRLKEKYFKENIGRVKNVLIQKRESEEYANGLTPEYVPVRIYGSDAKKHDVISVQISGISGSDFCTAEEIKCL